MKRLLIAFILAWFSQLAGARDLPCIAAQAKGSDLYSDMEQIGVPKRMYACVKKSSICMLTQKGKVIESDDFVGIRKNDDKIVFGVIQILKGKHAPYCAYGSFLDDEMSGPSWLYRLDNQKGNFGGDSTSKQNSPLRPSEFLDVIEALNARAS